MNGCMQCGGVILTNYDQKILATGQKLTDKHINFAQTLLWLQFPNLNGLQSSLNQSRSQDLDTNDHALQVLHSRGDHWIVAITIGCNPGNVRVYASLDDGTHETVQRVFGGCTSFLQVTTMNEPKQQGGTDCGVFAIAVCTCFAFGGKMVICQDRMRTTFWNVLRRNFSLRFSVFYYPNSCHSYSIITCTCPQLINYY